MSAADWIAVDWGTSRLRAWALSDSGQVLARASSDQGMGSLAPAQFEAALLQAVGDWLAPERRTPVIACGMVGSRQGWVEAAYRSTPCAPAGPMTAAPTRDPRIAVQICAGLQQASPADVMRGEETQVAGLLASDPAFAGVICLPGTHSKWVRVGGARILDFQTYMTGELFALLAERSVLRHSLDAPGWDPAAFAEAVASAFDQPAQVAARLFSLRAAALIAGLSADTARARLSGYLIGLELAAAAPYWTGQKVALIGASQLVRHYAEALRGLGVQTHIHDSEAMTLGGLVRAYQQLKEA